MIIPIPEKVSIEFCVELDFNAWIIISDKGHEESWLNELLNITGATESCLNHCSWIKFQSASKCYEDLIKEISSANSKVADITKKYCE